MTLILDATNGITTPAETTIGNEAIGGNLAVTGTISIGANTVYPLVAGTAVASTSGTSLDYLSIPSWVKRITVVFSGVSTSGTSNPLIQIGAGSFTVTGYVGQGSISSSTTGTAYTTGFGIASAASTNVIYGEMVLTLLGSNTWICNFTAGLNANGTPLTLTSGGNVALAGTLDRVRITTVNGTDTFTAGSVNVLYQ
jgi:hypothetical protein